MVVHPQEPDLPNGPGQAVQAPRIGQQSVRLLACATCLLLVGWQAPGTNLGSFGQGGRVLMQSEGSPDNALSSGGQPGRMLRHILAEDSAGRSGTTTDLMSLDSTLSSAENASQQWMRQQLGVEEQTRLEGHHKLPKWARWAGDSTVQPAALDGRCTVELLGSRLVSTPGCLAHLTAQGVWSCFTRPLAPY